MRKEGGERREVGTQEDRLGKESKDPVRWVERKECNTGIQRREREEDEGKEEGKGDC